MAQCVDYGENALERFDYIANMLRLKFHKHLCLALSGRLSGEDGGHFVRISRKLSVSFGSIWVVRFGQSVGPGVDSVVVAGWAPIWLILCLFSQEFVSLSCDLPGC